MRRDVDVGGRRELSVDPSSRIGSGGASGGSGDLDRGGRHAGQPSGRNVNAGRTTGNGRVRVAGDRHVRVLEHVNEVDALVSSRSAVGMIGVEQPVNASEAVGEVDRADVADVVVGPVEVVRSELVGDEGISPIRHTVSAARKPISVGDQSDRAAIRSRLRATMANAPGATGELNDRDPYAGCVCRSRASRHVERVGAGHPGDSRRMVSVVCIRVREQPRDERDAVVDVGDAWDDLSGRLARQCQLVSSANDELVGA